MTIRMFHLTAVAAAAAVMLAGCASAPEQTGIKDGVYTGTGFGRGGEITSEVTFKDGKITDVKVVKHTETVGVSDKALTEVPARIVAGNTTNVDAVTGATLTSNGIRASVADAIDNAGGDTEAYSQYYKTKYDTSMIPDTVTTDVLVIGGGASGLTAAVRAAGEGAKVILIEKMPAIGGDTQLNAGTLIATGSRYQREVMKETKDSPQLTYKDILKAGKYKNDKALAMMTAKKAGSVVDWLIDDLKIPYGPAATQYPDHSASRQLGVTGRSVNFLKLMSAKLAERGGVIMTDTRAQEFVTDAKGNVTGVKATLADGRWVTFDTKSVILASGGYGANSALLPEKVKEGLFYGLDSDSGDGLNMGQKVGAATINLDLVKQYPQGVETMPGHGLAATASSTDTMKKSGAIYVNMDGNRVVDELAGLGTLTDVSLAQKKSMLYIVMDKAAWKEYVAKSLEDKLVPNEETLEGWAHIVNNGHPVMATSMNLAEAAQKMGIDAAQLAKTVTRWNKMVAAGKDADFGRKVLKPLSEGPWYIVEQKVRFCTTLGGLKANTGLAILAKNGKPIGNLYGAGCVVGGANGADSMTAMMNSWAIISGAVAADSAVKNLKK